MIIETAYIEEDQSTQEGEAVRGSRGGQVLQWTTSFLEEGIESFDKQI